MNMTNQFDVIDQALPFNMAEYAELAKTINRAAIAHDGQYRKDKITPYFTHVLRVQSFIYRYITTDLITNQIALLHDTIEDTNITYDCLLSEFGSEVAWGVYELTKDTLLSKESQRKAMMAQCLHASNRAKIVKASDRIDNLSSAPFSFSKHGFLKYLEEAQELHDVLIQNIDDGKILVRETYRAMEYLQSVINTVKQEFGE